MMAFKPNYNFERAERERAKQRKKQEKAQRRQAEEGAPEADADQTAPTAAEIADNGESNGA